MPSFIEHHKAKIVGTFSCFDRILMTGILRPINYTDGLSSYLFTHGVRLFDYMKDFAKPMADKIRANAERIASENSLAIEYITSKKAFRKEQRVQEIIRDRGSHPGLVHIFSAQETCPCFEARYDNANKKAHLIYRDGKCLHYYFYFIDPELGLCYLRVPTWVPFRVQFYCNGHNWLAGKLKENGIGFSQLDNTFVRIADFDKAQSIADQFSPEILQPILDRYASMFCPASAELDIDYWWTLTQLEYATDIVFKKQSDLAPIYETLVRTAIHSVKPDNVATFLSHQITYNCQQEVGNDFHTRVEGTRIKHHMGSASIKMYDKQQIVLRIETTVNDVSFFSHHRQVQHRNGTFEMKIAPVKKTIYSLGVMRELMAAANRRYLDFISNLDDPSAGLPKVQKLSATVRKDDRPYRGFNVFDPQDLSLFVALSRGEFNITGFRNSTLRRILKNKTAQQLSYILKRLRLHGIIRRISHTRKYYLTSFGRQVILTALKLTQLVVIPSMCQPA